MAVDDAGDAETLVLAKLSTERQLESGVARRRRRWPSGDRVLGRVLERAGEPQHLVAVDAVGGHDVDEGHRRRS